VSKLVGKKALQSRQLLSVFISTSIFSWFFASNSCHALIVVFNKTDIVWHLLIKWTLIFPVIQLRLFLISLKKTSILNYFWLSAGWRWREMKGNETLSVVIDVLQHLNHFFKRTFSNHCFTRFDVDNVLNKHTKIYSESGEITSA
jgi:hypothetical protein